MRIAAIIEYDGSDFAGWQRQAGERTLQGVVEEALSKVANTPIRVITAGRTDAGVHASGQVIHFDTDVERSDYSWVRGANSNLPREVALLWAHSVTQDFHARFSATGRTYRYIILNRSIRPTYFSARVTHEHRPLDAVAMQSAANYLVGTHDFSSFRALQCQAKNPVRELRRLSVQRHGDWVVLEAEANAFLHHMVRNLAGVLMTIGAGEREIDWAREVLEARDRTLGGVTASPQGLYLVSVKYPEIFEIPPTPAPSFW